MNNLTAQKIKYFITHVAYATIVAIASSTYATYATPQILTQESHAPISTKLSRPPIITTQAKTKNLTGVWNCNDGGVYFIRQVGNQMWWYGQSDDGGETWSNVFQGTIRGDEIIGSWADVPKGAIRGYGEMTLRILGNKRIQKISGGENFGGSIWSR